LRQSLRLNRYVFQSLAAALKSICPAAVHRCMFGIKTSGAVVPTLTRRSLLCGLTCACCGTSCSLATTLITGVLCATRTGSGLEVGTLLKTTGNPQLDKSLISEMTMQSKFYGYRPAFVLYSGGEKNAAAVNKTLADYPQTDGTILYNIDMLREQLSVSQWGGSILAGVIAHEFAHIYQYHNDYFSRLFGLDQTVNFEIGDYEFNAPAHHGTPAERYLALKAGFNLRIRNKSTSVRDAATEAVAFLKEYIH
jgi:hypothetical protein